MLELGRYRHPKIPRSDRRCTLCDLGEVEDKLHFVFQCPMLTEARKPHMLKCEECWVGFGLLSELERFSLIMNSVCIWASVSEPHTSVFNCKFVCAYGVRTYVRTHIPHIVSRFNITFQIVSVLIFQIVHVATVAAVQLA